MDDYIDGLRTTSANLEQQPRPFRRRLLAVTAAAAAGSLGNGAGVRKEEDLDGQTKAGVQADNDDEQDLAGLAVGGAEDGVEVAQEEGDGEAEADGDKGPVEDVDGRPADAGDGDPDEVGVAVERPALEEVGRVAAKVAQGEEEDHGDEEGVAVDETGGT
jgi:hypothetical protein